MMRSTRRRLDDIEYRVSLARSGVENAHRRVSDIERWFYALIETLRLEAYFPPAAPSVAFRKKAKKKRC